MERAYFAAGCFWGVEETFRKVPGVNTAVGYMGGMTDEPTYREVCTGRTGHAETVEVTFDPDVVSYDELLNVFWRSHDPTTRDRQGPDVGSQYRSAIFYVGESQRDAALASRERVNGSLGGRVVTEVSPAGEFWRAEDYHQGYMRRRSRIIRRT